MQCLHFTEGSWSGGCRQQTDQRGPGLEVRALCQHWGFLLASDSGIYGALLGTGHWPRALCAPTSQAGPPSRPRAHSRTQGMGVSTPDRPPDLFPSGVSDSRALETGTCPRMWASCHLPASGCLLSWFTENPWPAASKNKVYVNLSSTQWCL